MGAASTARPGLSLRSSIQAASRASHCCCLRHGYRRRGYRACDSVAGCRYAPHSHRCTGMHGLPVGTRNPPHRRAPRPCAILPVLCSWIRACFLWMLFVLCCAMSLGCLQELALWMPGLFPGTQRCLLVAFCFIYSRGMWGERGPTWVTIKLF